MILYYDLAVGMRPQHLYLVLDLYVCNLYVCLFKCSAQILIPTHFL